MNDLLSLVLTLQPPRSSPAETPRPAPVWWGRAAHALALRVLDAEDPALARTLHDHPDAPRPFTVSTLWGCRLPSGAQATSPCRLRLTALQAETSRIFAAATLPGGLLSPGASIELDGFPFTVLAAHASPETEPWAGSSRYADLMHPYLDAEKRPPRRMRLRLSSPALFKTAGRHQPLPLPRLLFGSLLARWNAFAPVSLPEETRRYAEECIVIQEFSLRSRSIPLKGRGRRIGAAGHITYFALTYDRYWMSVLHTLAAFAFFSGVGAGTTMGLGQCRLST